MGRMLPSLQLGQERCMTRDLQEQRICLNQLNGIGLLFIMKHLGPMRSSVYVEGDIETRVYNDSINGDVKSIPEICIRRDGKLRLIRNGESVDKTSLDELREGLF